MGMMNFTCKRCGCEFRKSAKPSALAKGRFQYCTRTCAQHAHGDRTRRPLIEKQCRQCKAAFHVRNSPYRLSRGQDVFCSKQCSARYGASLPVSDKTRGLISAALKRSWSDISKLERRCASIKRGLHKPGVQDKRSASLRLAYSDPGLRANAIANIKNPEAQRKKKESQLRNLADPVRRAEIGKNISAGMTKEGRARLSKVNREKWLAMNQEDQDALVKKLMFSANNKKEGTSIEIAVKKCLLEIGIDFVEQKVFDRAIADFYIPELLAIIECDGVYWHNLPHVKSKDNRRDWWLRSQGYSVIRIPELEIKADAMQATVKAVERARHARQLQNI